MSEEAENRSESIEERQHRRGTWPWFVVNVLLFPAPAHFTLLRVREFSFGKSLAHISVNFSLVLVLLASATLQLVFPRFGSLWMLLPVLSGCIVLYTNRFLRGDFDTFHFSQISKAHLFFILSLVLLFTVLSVLPALELIELNQKRAEIFNIWIEKLPYWQEMLILVLGLFLLLSGYVINADTPVSINRAFILYACFFVFTNQIMMVLVYSFGWLKFQGGFWSRLLVVLVAAILALDYWDARTFGQYVRRFFFLSCTKISYFIFLWLCLIGLPQKVASTFSAHYFGQAKPPVIEISDRYLIFPDKSRFDSGHRSCRRLRALYNKAFMASDVDALHRIVSLFEGEKGSVFQPNTHVRQLADLIREKNVRSTSMEFDRVPVFRPVHKNWDVMITALLVQGAISEGDLDRFIAAFKSMLPKASHGLLPDIETPYKTRYVSLATGTRVDFVQPRFKIIETLVENGFCPVLSLRLSGKNYWAALLHIDRESGIAWFRMENTSEIDRSIQVLFDANESEVYRDEILSHSLLPVSLGYFRGALAQSAGPAVIFSKGGIATALPDLIVQAELTRVEHAVAFASGPARSLRHLSTDNGTNPLSDYAGYMRGVASIKAILQPAFYDRRLFVPSAEPASARRGVARLLEVDEIIKLIGPLRDCDRFDIAYLMATHQHVHGAPDLFVRLVAGKPFSSDLVDCGDAFLIGRQLFLLGHHQAASGYLELAFLRHPFNSKYELWHRLAKAKLGMPPTGFLSPPEHQADLHLYYKTVTDIREDRGQAAFKRLKKVLEKDSHDCLANHLLSKYFNMPLDERYFFPAPEGL